jgi:hypothetical protein
VGTDHSLDTLLLLDGETFVVEGAFWVKFVVKRIPTSSEKPHGLDYSLTLHDGDNQRLLGFDNAHSITREQGRGREQESNMTTSTRENA